MKIKITKIITQDYGQFEIPDEDLKDCTLEEYLENRSIGDILFGNFPDKWIEEIVEFENSDGKWIKLE